MFSEPDTVAPADGEVTLAEAAGMVMVVEVVSLPAELVAVADNLMLTTMLELHAGGV